MVSIPVTCLDSNAELIFLQLFLYRLNETGVGAEALTLFCISLMLSKSTSVNNVQESVSWSMNISSTRL